LFILYNFHLLFIILCYEYIIYKYIMGQAASRPPVKQREIIDDRINFPEKVYVLITTHGRIDYIRAAHIQASADDGPPVLGEVSKYTVPDGITVTKINPISYGTCNFLTNEYAYEILEFVKYTIDNEFIPKYDVAKNIEFTTKTGKRILPQEGNVEEAIVNFLKRNDPNIKNLREEMKDLERENARTGKKNDPQINDMREYLNSPKYFLNVYTSGTEAPDKYYSYDSNDKNVNIIKEIGRNNKIFDVMDRLKDVTVKTDPNTGETITTKETTEKKIVDFFKSNGVKEIVIIDLSCSVFLNVEGFTPRARTRRLFRKNIQTQTQTQKTGGKKTRIKIKTSYKKKRKTLKRKKV